MDQYFEALEKSKNSIALNIVEQMGFDETADVLEKGRAAQMGEIRTWNGTRYQKQSNGSWNPIKKNRTEKDGGINEKNVEKTFNHEQAVEYFEKFKKDEQKGMNSLLNLFHDKRIEIFCSFTGEPETPKYSDKSGYNDGKLTKKLEVVGVAKTPKNPDDKIFGRYEIKVKWSGKEEIETVSLSEAGFYDLLECADKVIEKPYEVIKPDGSSESAVDNKNLHRSEIIEETGKKPRNNEYIRTSTSSDQDENRNK